jgi:hypothetical protein
MARPILPWARRHVRTVARRYHTSECDLWDEAISALLRAVLHFKPGANTFRAYAQLAIHRACWAAVRIHAVRPYVPKGVGYGPMRPPSAERISLDDAAALELAWHSAEEEVMAREAVYLRGAEPCHEKLARKII